MPSKPIWSVVNPAFRHPWKIATFAAQKVATCIWLPNYREREPTKTGAWKTNPVFHNPVDENA
jgi:hypothetical protein